MRYTIFFIIVSIMMSSSPHSVWSEGMHMHHEKSMKEDASKASQEEIEDTGNAFCPVMGGEVDKNVSYVYKGKRYYFCCPMCIEEFKKESEKYIEKMEEAKTEEKGMQEHSTHEEHHHGH